MLSCVVAFFLLLHRTCVIGTTALCPLEGEAESQNINCHILRVCAHHSLTGPSFLKGWQLFGSLVHAQVWVVTLEKHFQHHGRECFLFFHWIFQAPVRWVG